MVFTVFYRDDSDEVCHVRLPAHSESEARAANYRQTIVCVESEARHAIS